MVMVKSNIKRNAHIVRIKTYQIISLCRQKEDQQANYQYLI